MMNLLNLRSIQCQNDEILCGLSKKYNVLLSSDQSSQERYIAKKESLIEYIVKGYSLNDRSQVIQTPNPGGCYTLP